MENKYQPIKWNESKGCWERVDAAEAECLGCWSNVWGWTPQAGTNPYAGEAVQS